MTDIPVATAVTAWDDPNSGETTLLEFNQGLWFGNKLPVSLINPNQCRMFGIDLCDDPFDPHRGLQIKDPETGLEVPMKFNKSIVSFET